MFPKQRNIVIMGYRSVGKSSICTQFAEEEFSDTYETTIENTFTKSIRINSQDYDFKIMDTAGQDEYSIFPSRYSLDVHGYILVYSITSMKSFEIVQSIYKKVLDLSGREYIPVALVGNKTDLHLERMVSPQEGKRLADEWKAIFLETSAKQNEILYYNRERGNPAGYCHGHISDIFCLLLTEIEKADRNQFKLNCSIH